MALEAADPIRTKREGSIVKHLSVGVVIGVTD
jgi:hypothetical protein